MLKLACTAKSYLVIAIVVFSMATAVPTAAAVSAQPTDKPLAKPIQDLTATPTLDMDDLTDDKTATVNQNLKRMIDKVVEQNKEKVQARLQEIGSRRRGFVGEIKNIREGAITLRTKLGTQIIPTDQGVELLKAGKTIAIDRISVGDWVVVVGVTKDDAFIAETVEFLANSPQPNTQIVQLGTIIDLKKTTITFQSRKDEEIKTYTLAKTFVYQDSEGKKATATNFSKNSQVLLIAQESESGARALLIRALAPFDKAESDSTN
jgi:hypothetical protein